MEYDPDKLRRKTGSIKRKLSQSKLVSNKNYKFN